VTSTGSVEPPYASGDIGVYSAYTGAYLKNSGTIDGGSGASDVPGGYGGDAVDFKAAGTIKNYAHIVGGHGNSGAGTGGTGVSLASGTLDNYGGNTTGGIKGGEGYNSANFGGTGVYIGTGTLNNGNATYAASIEGGNGTGGAGGGTGVVLQGAGTLNNAFGSDLIGGYGDTGGGSGGIGVLFKASGTLNNNGTVAGGSSKTGPGGIGVEAGNSSIVNNTDSIKGGSDNEGSENGAAAVTLSGSASLSNSGATAQITGGGGYDSTGGAGVDLDGTGVTLANAAQIDGGSTSSGTGGVGVQVYADKSATNSGSIHGGASTDSIGGAGVYLDGGTLTTSGTINGGYNDGKDTSFADSVQFGPTSSTLTVESGASFNGDIGGFAIGDTIDITNLTPKQVAQDFGVTYTSLGGGSYGFNGSAGGETLTTASDGTLVFSGNFSGDHFVLSGDGTDIQLMAGPVCFLRGTRIRTVAGEKAVEDLTVGECVLTASGEARPIRWIGSRGLDCTHYPKPDFVWPVRIQSGAFAADLPARDLWVSPFHSILLEGALVQVEKLVNGATIVQVPRERVEYWHVELDSHDILLAEGVPAESYLDVGNRAAFVNGGDYLEAYPDFAPKDGSETCVPLVKEGAVIERARSALLARAEALGYALTEDPDLHVLADGQRIEPVRLSEKRVAFMLPAAHASIELRCRRFTPAQMNPSSDDVRSLGICVERFQLDGADVALEDEAAFAQGWHPLEHSSSPQGPAWRWSQDRMPLPAGTRLLVIDLCHQGAHYWCKPASRVVALFG
jgi:hypothetical protein